MSDSGGLGEWEWWTVKAPSFTDLLSRFARYRQNLRSVEQDRADLIAEAQKRLEQLDWLLRRIHRLEQQHERLAAKEVPTTGRPDSHEWQGLRRRQAARSRLSAEIELLTEAFYYFAARCGDILSNHLVEFKGFDARGIRTVRNHLLQHPKAGAQNPNFGHGFPNGPVIKPFGNVIDKGLYTNAAEFRDKALRRLAALGYR
jgi:hypothetical protein